MTRFKSSPILFAVAAVILLLTSNARASCSGSGSSWSCTAGSSPAQIQSAVDSASDGATITLANGSYNLGSAISFDNRNGISVVCATVGGCTVAVSNNNVFTNDFCASSRPNLFRISGFNFTGSVGTAAIWMYCNQDLQQVRIDHNDFSIAGSQIAVLFGETSSAGRVFGVVDHNNCHGANNFMCMKNISGNDSWFSGAQGSANSLFFEDNTCNFTTNSDLGTGCLDVWRGNSTVARFNTITRSRIVNHSYCHSGPYNSEVYGNKINDPNPTADNYRNIHFQGAGEEIAFGNTVELEPNGNTIVVQHFRGDSSTATSEGSCVNQCNGTVTGTGADPDHANDLNRAGQSGYPCWHQPGRDKNGVLKPLYIFMNHNAAGTKADLVLNSGNLAPSQVAANRDYYNAVSASAQTSSSSPFNGTTGVGFGTLANRPTTCTATPQAADAGHGGVGYWATDQGSWNKSGNGFGQGILYSCTATNTWTVAYTPYTYPHPLQGGGGGGSTPPPTPPPTQPPAPPSNLQGVVH
jgi:hypothetical protein